MLEYFHRQYSANNLTLAVAGKIDFGKIVEQLEVACGDWINHDIKRDINRYSTTPDTADITNIQKDSAHQQYIIQIADGPSATDTDRSAAQLMSTIFGDDNNSRLFWDLIDTGKAEYAVLESQEYQGSGIFLGYLCCPPENQQGLLQRYYQLTSDLHENGVTQQELDTAQAKVCSHIVLRGERPANRMFNVGSNWIQRGIYETTREAIDRIEAVSRQDIQKVLDKYPLSPATTVATGPKTEQH
jgi:predicted Zn-dependent peptidase